MNLVIKDAIWQILGRVASALGGFIVIKLITPYLGPLRFGDYSTILKYFAIWSAFADFGIYVIALKQLGAVKKEEMNEDENKQLTTTYSKFVSTRALMIICVYSLALVVAYLIPAYTQNPYLVRGLPLGMLFSASFMSAGILQIPLQLYWKMEQLSIALILARIAQIGVLILTIYILFSEVVFGTGEVFTTPFMRIIGSVLISGVVQALYVYRVGKKYLPLKRNFDRSFTKKLLLGNWKYGLAYYLSSFHTLLVLMLLSWFYPTVQGYTYVGIRALALSLMEILLIVPSALGNSLIHKVAGESPESIASRYGGLLKLVFWIGCFVIVQFTRFAPHIISFIGGSEFLTTASAIGSDTILPFLAVVLTLSFVKQIFNYIFVSTGHQNKLLGINLFGVTVGLLFGVPLLLNYQLFGGIIAQVFLEVLFLSGSLYVARKAKVLPKFSRKDFGLIGGVTLLLVIFGPYSYLAETITTPIRWILQAGILTLLLVGVSYTFLKKYARKL